MLTAECPHLKERLHGYLCAGSQTSKERRDIAGQQLGLLGWAKCPPLGIGVHRRTLYRRSAHSRGGVPSSTNLLAKTAMPVGTLTNSCGPSVTRNRLLSLSK